MKPSRIVLIRHGQSMGNVNREVYLNTPDYAVQLTDEGKQQAITAGQEIASIIGKESSVQWYVSPYWRARQTYYYLKKAFFGANHRYYEDARLREQEWTGQLPQQGFDQIAEMKRDNYSTFYFRFKGGESVADVTDRAGNFMNTLFRDFEKPYYPENAIIVTHGMTLRAFVMRFFHLSVEEFEELKNPKNCQYFVLELQDNGKYKLITEFTKRAAKHKFKFEWPND